jgi:hypothetical protein
MLLGMAVFQTPKADRKQPYMHINTPRTKQMSHTVTGFQGCEEKLGLELLYHNYY